MNPLQAGLLKMWLATLKDYACPQCGHNFVPFGGQLPTSFADPVVCPQCAFSVPLQGAQKAQQEAKVNPTGPVERPAGSRITLNAVSATQMVIDIPASGKSGGLLFLAVIWNLFAWSFPITWLMSGKFSGASPTLVILIIFPLVGLGLAYAALRNRYAVHLLYLGPDRVRLQRQLLGRHKNFELPTASIRSVRKTEFYSRNYQPVYGIEISAGNGRIRFGSALTDEEKSWLCWEIRRFLRLGPSPK